jgi:hypothetical protein
MYVHKRPAGLGGIVQDLAAAIGRQENTNPAWNNPGALRSGPGQIGVSSTGIAIFPDLATGEAALERQVQLNISRGLTLDEFFAGKPGVYAGYAPAADSNRPYQYAANVASWTGLPENVALNALPAGGASSDWPAPDVVDSGAVDTASIGSGVWWALGGLAAIFVLREVL